jgi:hypothetical protein
MGIDDMHRFFSPLEPFLEKRSQHRVFFVATIEECTDVVIATDVLSGQ